MTWDAALQIANQTRTANAEVLRRIGSLDPQAAVREVARILERPEGADALTVGRLLQAVSGIGPYRAGRILRSSGLRSDRRLRELTLRQRRLVAAVLGKSV